MNFFEHQDKARQSTRLLVLFFFAAVCSLILITSFLVVTLLSLGGEGAEAGINTDYLGSDIFLGVSFLVITVVLLGAFYRQAQLRGGGRVVAESLGGRLLNMGTRDANERKILNVVEEMAVASGVPVPQVYLLEDTAINAFAAGYTPTDAVIGITRGCVELLDRDELQGVVAHEFSHIFNGDMRLNIRLIAWLYGITVIGLIGYYLMRFSPRRSYGKRDNKGGVVLLGLGLIVVGYGGTFFGSLIKAAVSRQREFLADASAVQYTRNPAGIGGALKKIGGWVEGSVMQAHNVSEVSHMLFSQGIRTSFTSLMATHPPLQERILRIDPGWKGQYIKPDRTAVAPSAPVDESVSAFAGSVQAQSALDNVGDPTSEHLEVARQQLGRLPEQLVAEAHNSLGASLLMYCLLIACSEQAQVSRQLARLQSVLEVGNYRQLEEIFTTVATLPRELYLPLIELSLPSLKQLSAQQYRAFLGHLHTLVTADSKVTLFEWSLEKILRSGLEHRRPFGGKRLTQCGRECANLLSAFASAGHASREQASRAFAAGLAILDLTQDFQLEWLGHPDPVQLESSLSVLQGLMPLQKPRLLKALVACIEEDGKITAEEGELLRAVGSILDCPIPPFTK